jgi:hypothetical protein
MCQILKSRLEQWLGIMRGVSEIGATIEVVRYLDFGCVSELGTL